MIDYVYPSIFFSYFLFFMFLAGGIFFFVRSFRDGYWGSKGEDPKYRMLEDENPVSTNSNHGSFTPTLGEINSPPLPNSKHD